MKRKPCGQYHSSFEACSECDVSMGTLVAQWDEVWKRCDEGFLEWHVRAFYDSLLERDRETMSRATAERLN